MSQTRVTEKDLMQMDKEADRVIAGWSFTSLACNLLPPPLDMIAVASAFAKMGHRLGKVYKIDVSRGELKQIGKAIAKGIGATAAAAFVGTSIFKWIPGVNIWVALLLQPPMVAAIAWSAGTTYKRYFRFRHAGKSLSAQELRAVAEEALRGRAGR